MDLYVRIPATNMHDVGIQTIPSHDQHFYSSPMNGKHFGSEEDKTGDLEQMTIQANKVTSSLSEIPSPTNSITLTLAMGESEWCMETSTPRPVSKGSHPHSPREKGRGINGTGDTDNHGLSTFHPQMDQLDYERMGYNLHLITSEIGVSDWIKDKEHVPLDVGRIKFVSPDGKSVQRDFRSESSVVSNISGRSLNEPLDKYMVIRQRTFHGLPRSKKELSILPLTDPREKNPASCPSWLYRSKTDLFIEKRRTKMAAARRTSYANTCRSWHNLDGITFAGLMETLPNVGQSSYSDHDETGENIVDYMKHPVETGGVINNYGDKDSKQENNKVQRNADSFKLLPISIKQNQQQITVEVVTETNDERKESDQSCRRINSGTYFNQEAATCSNLSPRGSHSSLQGETENNSKTEFIRGKLRKQSLAAIPLRLWEPSFDCVVASSRKVIQPRQVLKTWTVNAPAKHQHLPLK